MNLEKRKKYRKHMDLTLDILIEQNKYEIYSNQERTNRSDLRSN